MDQRRFDGVAPKRAWFVRIGPFGGMMPWSLMGWLWFLAMLAGGLGAAYGAQKFKAAGDSHDAGLAWAAFAVILIIGLGVALKKSRRL